MFGIHFVLTGKFSVLSECGDIYLLKNGSLYKAIPIKCCVSHRPVSCDGGSVGRAKKKKKKMNT